MSDCSRHKKEVAGIVDMKVLAEAIGDLHYETLAELLSRLYDKLYTDAAMDHQAHRFSLAGKLNCAAVEIRHAGYFIEEAWKISKPFMKDKTTGHE